MSPRSVRALLLSSLLVVALLLTTACQTDAPSEGKSAADATTQLRVSGSGTCLPLLRILAAEYKAVHPEAGVEFAFLPGLHSGGGIKGVANGDLDIGSVSRELSEDESALGLAYKELSTDGLVIAVHPGVTIKGLTTQQVRDIYSGKYSNWSELGGPDMLIVILDRNEDESAKIILRKYVLGPDLAITPKAVNLYYEPDMIDGLKSTAGAIGYFSLGFGLSQNVEVNYLELDGVEASITNIENGTYKMVRPLGVVTAGEPPAAVKAFVDWASGDDARALMKSKGFAPAE